MTICSVCLKHTKNKTQKMLSPMSCVRKHGTKAHKICKQCWFVIFALENSSHKCPGCIKKIKLTVPPKIKEPFNVIDLS